MKLKILSILALSSFLYGAADLICHDDSHVAMQPHYSVTEAAVILSLDEMSRMNTTAANIDKALSDIRRYTALTHQKITDLEKETSKIIESQLMYTYMQKEASDIMESLVMYLPYPTHPSPRCGIDIETRLMTSLKVYRSMEELCCERDQLNRNTLVISKNTLKHHLMQLRLELLNRNTTLVAMQCIIIEEIPNRLYSFFQNSAPILYKEVESVSAHTYGRLAGVILYYDTKNIKIALGRKAGTVGDVKEEHIERRLISQLLPRTLMQSGYLFIYTTLPPCNTPITGCLSFYQRLLQTSPHLRARVLFDHEYENKFNYAVLSSARFLMTNLVQQRQMLEATKKQTESETRIANALVRATTGDIITAMVKKPPEIAKRILSILPTGAERIAKIMRHLDQLKK